MLPTTATLAVVSVTGGAPMALTSTTLAAGASTVDDATTDRAELTQDKSTDSTLLARGVQDRVARDSERVRVDR